MHRTAAWLRVRGDRWTVPCHWQEQRLGWEISPPGLADSANPPCCAALHCTLHPRMLSLSARAVAVASCCCSCRKRQRWPDRQTCLWLLAVRRLPPAAQSAGALDAASPARSARQLSHRQCHASTRHGRLLYIHSRSRRVSARLAPIANRATSRCGRHRRRSSSARPSRATFRGQPLARPGTDERSDGRCGRQRPQRLIGPPFARPFPSPDGDRPSVRSEPLVISSSSSPPSHPSLHLSSSSAARLLLPFTCFPFPSCCLSAPVGVPPCRSSCLRIPCCRRGCCWRSVNQRRQTSEALCCAAASCCRRLH